MAETPTETPRAKTLAIQVPGWQGHRLGQHVDVRLRTQDGTWTERSYSIASSPESTIIRLLVGKSDSGGASRYLTDGLEKGDAIALRGPLGGDSWEVDSGGPLLLVAGGCGIAPLMAVIRHWAAVGSAVPTRLLYSARSYEDIVYRDELDRLGAADESFEVTYTLTRAWPSGWAGYRRRIDKKMIGEVAWRAERNPLALVCGPRPLVPVVASELLKMGYERARIKT